MGPCPLYSLLIFTASLSEFICRQSVSGDKVYKHEDNIGTVLFEKSDCGKHCWSNEDFAILNSRRMFQDILPKVNVINCQNDRYIALLMDYFHICLECVRKLAIGKTKHLMLKALADTMGGYLKVYILPMTKHSYYAGNIKYRNAKRLYELFDELKNFLHTNGDGWRKPTLLGMKHIKIPPINITPTKSSTACTGLVTHLSPVNGNEIRDYPQHSSKKKRLAYRGGKPMRRSTMDFDQVHPPGLKTVIVPLPFLDDEDQPNSIALPFKKDNLQSLHSEKSAFALVKYYVASVKCIASKSRTKIELSKFNQDLFEWLRQSVTRHLEEDKWYPAFGGVLRVMASLKESGAASDTYKHRSGGGEYQVMPKFITETVVKKPIDPGISPLYNNGQDENGSLSFGTTELIVIALASAVLVWLFVGLTLVCYRFLRRHSDDCGPCESPSSPPVAVLYQHGDYCTADVCDSKSSRKGTGEKFKEWWNSRFGGCPGGCDRYEDEERCLAAMSYTSKDTIATNSSKSVQKRQYNKSVLISRSSSPRERRSFKRVCYTSDESTTNSESPTKSRIGTSTGDE